MKKIFYLRHGESTANAGGITLPNPEIPLTQKGQQQAIAVSELLPINPSNIITSEFLRTKHTSKPYSEKYKILSKSYCELNEFTAIDHSLMEGMIGKQREKIVDLYWKEANPQKRFGEKADTFEEFQYRVIDFKKILSNLENGTVVFGHGIWLKLFIWNMLGYYVEDSHSMTEFRKFQLGFLIPNCGVFELNEVSNEKWFVQANQKINKEIINI